MAKRNDVHSPKNIITDDYEYVANMSRADDFGCIDVHERKLFIAHMENTSGKFSQHDHKGGCDVCGAWMIDYAIFYHMPSNSYIKTGMDCAAHIDDGHDDAFKASAKKRKARAKKLKGMKTAHDVCTAEGIIDIAEKMFMKDDFAGALNDCTAENGIALTWGFASTQDRMFKRLVDFPLYTLADMIRNLAEYGSWSVKQVSFAVSLAEQLREIPTKLAALESEKTNAVPSPEGRVTVTGEVLTIKIQDSYYGETLKMLVKSDEGFKVWCTVPAAIDEADKGDRITMTITLTPSDDDASFAFGKRPSKASILK